MTDPHEIIEAALADAHDLGMTDALYAKAVVRALEKEGLLKAPEKPVAWGIFDKLGQIVTASMSEQVALRRRDNFYPSASVVPLFGKGSEKP